MPVNTNTIFKSIEDNQQSYIQGLTKPFHKNSSSVSDVSNRRPLKNVAYCLSEHAHLLRIFEIPEAAKSRTFHPIRTTRREGYPHLLGSCRN